jgi:hypothetical protein
MKQILTIIFLALSTLIFAQVNNNQPRTYNVKLFGAKGDGVTDDTRAIQKTINQCFNSGGGTVWFPNGKYILSDTLTNSPATNYVNSLLYIPSVAGASGVRVSIKLLGESNIVTPNSYSIIVGFGTETKGVILAGRTAGTGVNPAVIGTKGTAGNYRDYNYCPITIENIMITTNTINATAAPTLSGINLLHAATVSIKNVAVTIDTVNQLSVSPVSSEVAGFIISGDNNDGPNLIESTYSSGYKYGYIIGDHTTLTNAYAFCSYFAFCFPAGDWSIQGRVGTAACVNQLYIPNWNIMGITKDSSAFLDITFETEVDSTGYHGVYWYSTEKNLIDSGNIGRGEVRWVNHASAANGPISQYGGTEIKNRLLGMALPTTVGGTGLTSFTAGDILYYSSSNKLTKLGIGANGYALTSTGSAPQWTSTGSAGWQLVGNSGTTAGTNFVGTTDNVNLVFKRNGVQSGLIDSVAAGLGKTLFGFGAGVSATVPNGTTAFGFKALALNSGGTGGNTAFGNLAAYSNTSQTDNTAVGSGALYSNNSAGSNNNTAVGSGALYTTTNGAGGNTAVGAFALNLMSYGSVNTAIGPSALRYITNYSANIAIGSAAGAYYTGTNNLTASTSSIYIGNTAMAKANGSSNEIVIGSSAIGLGNNTAVLGANTQLDAGIYGKLHVASGSGSLAIFDTSAQLQVISTTKTMLPPRMTTNQRNGITSGVYLSTRVGGTGYTNGTYVANALTGGTGTGATATLTIAGGIVTTVVIQNPGYGYVSGDVLSSSGIGGGSGFTLTLTTMSTATAGGEVYDATLNKPFVWDGTRWNEGAKILSNSATLDFGSTAAGASSDLTITVTGAADGDVTAVGVVNASTNANGVFTSWVSAANTVTVRFTNTNLVTAIDPASGTFKVKVFKD